MRERKPGLSRTRRPGKREAVPASVRREVWERDGGRCTYTTENGHRCQSRWKLELDHIQPAALAGPSTVENLRLRCAVHNALHAEETFGRQHMARFRRKRRAETRTGESATAGDSWDRGERSGARPAS